MIDLFWHFSGLYKGADERLEDEYQGIDLGIIKMYMFRSNY